MTRLRRSAALTLLVTAMVALLPFPAHAAPTGIEGKVYLRNLTLPADRSRVEESISPLRR